MRIIAGEFRSRPIVTPHGETTRPTTDRSRESLFNVLTNLIDFDGATVLDLFAGSGAVAIEAISRGATHAMLVEKDHRALAAIRKNIEAFDLQERTKVAPTDVYTWLHNFSGSPFSGSPFSDQVEAKGFDIVFADAPYRDKRTLMELPAAVLARGVLNDGGIAVIEYSSHDAMSLPSTAREIRSLKVGEASFSIFTHATAVADE